MGLEAESRLTAKAMMRSFVLMFSALPLCSYSVHAADSASGHLQCSFRKAGSFELQSGRSFVDLLEVVFGQIDVHCEEILLEPMELGGSWNRHDPWLLRQQQGERVVVAMSVA